VFISLATVGIRKAAKQLSLAWSCSALSLELSAFESFDHCIDNPFTLALQNSTSAYISLRCQIPVVSLVLCLLQQTKASMSETIPESIPTLSDPRTHRPLKRARGADTALAAQATELSKLFADPEREIRLPDGTINKGSRLAPPPEIVANVQGSSAGAGSGEFHVYKASRRREYERLREMEAEAKKEDDTARWEKEAEERKRRDEEKTAKNREKRAKKKGKQSGKPQAMKGRLAGASEDNDGHDSNSQVANGVKKALQLPRREWGRYRRIGGCDK
jgi:hypothetical protein